jgi:Protein of unknown function (DUF3618)
MTADETGNGADASETRSPEQIRADIEQTREQLGETVEELAGKPTSGPKPRAASPPPRTPRRPNATNLAKTKQAAPDSASAGADQVTAAVKEKSLAFAVGAAFVIALAIGWLLRRPN